MRIRLAHESDLPELIAISQTADSAAHWTRQQWLDIFQAPPRLAWIAEDVITEDVSAEGVRAQDVRGIGFLVARDGDVEWELENIVVLPAFRRQRAGLNLLTALLTHARSHHAARILLEVRASNQSAIRLYTASGFQLLSRRRDYYRNPNEDALVLVHPL